MNLGQRIKALRLSRGWSEERFAAQCKLTPEAVRGYEAGTQTPRVASIIKICQGTGVSADTLLGLEQPPAATGMDLREAQWSEGKTLRCPECGSDVERLVHFIAFWPKQDTRDKTALRVGLRGCALTIPGETAFVRLTASCSAGHYFGLVLEGCLGHPHGETFFRFGVSQGPASASEVLDSEYQLLVEDPPAIPASCARYQPGDQVRHVVFGAGVVNKSAGSGDDEQVWVVFPGHGEKKLIAGYAKLERITNPLPPEDDDYAALFGDPPPPPG